MQSNQSEDSPDREIILAQFNQLMEELLAGRMQRCKFQPWEIDILLDVMGCDLSRFTHAEPVIRQYQEAVQIHLANGAPLPLKLSVFLALRADATAAAGDRRNAPARGQRSCLPVSRKSAQA